MAISSSEIVSSTMKRLGNLDPFLNGSDFSNLGVAMNSCHPPHTHTPRCFLTVQQMPVSSPCWNHGELDSRHGRKIGTSWNLRGGRSWRCVPLLLISLRNTAQLVCLQQTFLASILGGWAHIFIWRFILLLHGQMQNATAKSHPSKSTQQRY